MKAQDKALLQNRLLAIQCVLGGGSVKYRNTDGQDPNWYPLSGLNVSFIVRGPSTLVFEAELPPATTTPAPVPAPQNTLAMFDVGDVVQVSGYNTEYLITAKGSVLFIPYEASKDTPMRPDQLTLVRKYYERKPI